MRRNLRFFFKTFVHLYFSVEITILSVTLTLIHINKSDDNKTLGNKF
jgi:NADH:ubiquinone oxidoreductase subunit K